MSNFDFSFQVKSAKDSLASPVPRSPQPLIPLDLVDAPLDETTHAPSQRLRQRDDELFGDSSDEDADGEGGDADVQSANPITGEPEYAEERINRLKNELSYVHDQLSAQRQE